MIEATDQQVRSNHTSGAVVLGCSAAVGGAATLFITERVGGHALVVDRDPAF